MSDVLAAYRLMSDMLQPVASRKLDPWNQPGYWINEIMRQAKAYRTVSKVIGHLVIGHCIPPIHLYISVSSGTTPHHSLS